MKIEFLSDHGNVIPTLETWYRSEWGSYYGAGGPGDARADLVSRCNRDVLPLGFVAFDDDHPVGTVALDTDPTTGLTPSVVALLVARQHRGRGIATALIETCEVTASRLEFRRLYTSTSVLGRLLNQRGWKLCGETAFIDGEAGSVYSCDLPRGSA